MQATSVWSVGVLYLLASPHSSVPAAVLLTRGIFLSIWRSFFLYPGFKKYLESKRLAKIGWKRGAAMKENFMVSHVNSSFITMCYVKTTRKPEVTCWLWSRSLGFQWILTELGKNSGIVVKKGLSCDDKNTCQNHALVVWSADNWATLKLIEWGRKAVRWSVWTGDFPPKLETLSGFSPIAKGIQNLNPAGHFFSV